MAIHNNWKPHKSSILKALKELRADNGHFDYNNKLKTEQSRFKTVEPPTRPSFEQWRTEIHKNLVEIEDLSRLEKINYSKLTDEQKAVLHNLKNPKVPIEQKKTVFQMVVNGYLEKGLVKVVAQPLPRMKITL